MKPTTQWLLGIAVALLPACAHNPPNELVDARRAYSQAIKGPAAQQAPGELMQAKHSLDRAEQMFAKDEHPVKVSDQAYVAERETQRAEAIASERVARNEARHNNEMLVALALEMSGRASELERQNVAGSEELAKAQAQLEEERGRAAAEQSSNEKMMEELKRVASVRQEPRGLVVNLSGSVLFASGKDELLPEAQRRLDEVASSLSKDTKDSFVIEGYTDSRGSAEFNEQLSERRAAAVKQHLSRRGVPEEKIKVVGMGERNPIASNKSAEGRANNRRVEIVVQKAPENAQPASTPAMPGNMQQGGSNIQPQQGEPQR